LDPNGSGVIPTRHLFDRGNLQSNTTIDLFTPRLIQVEHAEQLATATGSGILAILGQSLEMFDRLRTPSRRERPIASGRCGMTPVTLVAVGDVLVNRTDPDTALSGIRPLLDAADVAFGNFEGVFTDTHPAGPGAVASSLTGSRNARGLTGLDVVSLANNHAMDAGRLGLADTVDALATLDIATTGAGPTLADALRPAVVERRGLRIAFVAATAVLQHGAEARLRVPGVAPLRADDCYLPPYPGVCTPGIQPRVLSVLHEADWEAVAATVAQARDTADLVVASVHWGDHTRPWVLTDHERLCAELLVEAGVHLVLGHHQHMLRGVESITGTPVFFGLAHIVFDYPAYAAELESFGFDVAQASPAQLKAVFGEYGIYPRPEQPDFPFPALSRHTGVAVVELSAGGAGRFGLVPCTIDGAGVARPVGRSDAGWPAALELLQRCQQTPDLRAKVADTGWIFGGCDVVGFAGPTG
jgi:poly-gamma-glutamate synthesis protein (capsule biosynthesis protein)